MPDANAQQVSAMLSPRPTGHLLVQPRSPLKAEVKRERDCLMKENAKLEREISELSGRAAKDNKKSNH